MRSASPGSAPSARFSQIDIVRRQSGGARRAASTRSGSSNTRKAAETWSSRAARCSRKSRGKRRPNPENNRRRRDHQGTRHLGPRFGAFVDLGGGVQGLLHVSEMGWARVSDPSQMVTPGEEITVRVLRVDEDTQKIALGLKQLTADPWSQG